MEKERELDQDLHRDEVISEIKALISVYQSRFASDITRDLIFADQVHITGRQKRDYWYKQRGIMTVILCMHGYSNQDIAEYCGKSRQAIHKQFWRGIKVVEERAARRIEKEDIMNLIVKSHFDSAHHLPNYKGKCANLHGHRWRVEVEVAGRVDKETGMVCDYGILKQIIRCALPDHANLNEFCPIPTAENLSLFLIDRIKTEIEAHELKLKLRSLTLFESDHCGVKVEIPR